MPSEPKSISLQSAASLLEIPEPDVLPLIRTNRIRWQEEGESVHFEDVLTQAELAEYDRQVESGASEKEAQKRAESHRASILATFTSKPSVVNAVPPRSPKTPPIPNPHHHTPKSGGELSALPLKFIPVREAALKLNLSKSSIYRLIQSGRLNSDRAPNGRLTVLESDLLSYADLQQIWQRKGGRWTPYGRQEQSKHTRTYLLSLPSLPSLPSLTSLTRAESDKSDKSDPSDFWMTTSEAAAYLALSPIRIGVLGREGKLTRHISHTSPDGRNQYKIAKHKTSSLKGRPAACWYLYSSVRALAAIREITSRQAGISPAQWKQDLRHPIIRTEIVAPQNDQLISRAEAASILGVCRPRISILIDQGRLFGWQTHPGKPGCPLYLSMNQVWRYSHDPERLRRRANQSKSTHPSHESYSSDPSYPSDEEDSRFHFKSRTGDSNIRPDRDHGEFYSTKQAAEVLRISRGAVSKLRKRGRLSGCRAPGRPDSPRKWWFYRKEDVDNLLTNHGYLEGRERARKGVRTRYGISEETNAN